MQNTLLPVIECDGTGRIVEWNAAATAAFGYKFEELTQVSLDQFLSTPANGRAWNDVFASALEGKVAAAVDVVVAAKNGHAIPSKFYITPIDIDGTKSSRAAIIATPFHSDRTDSATPHIRLKSVGKA
jgi:PAS domain S-box-containing protein